MARSAFRRDLARPETANPAPGWSTEYHPYVLTHLDPVLKIMDAHSIRVASYGPMSPVLRHPSKTGGPIRPLLARVAARLSREHGTEVDEAMVCLLWCRAKGAIAVTASASPKNIDKLAATQRLPDLTPDEVDEIEKTGRKVHFRAYVRLPLFPPLAGRARRPEPVRLMQPFECPCRTSTCASTSPPPTCLKTCREWSSAGPAPGLACR